MDKLTLVNIGTSPLYIDDLGVEILAGEDLDILQNFTAEDITESTDFQSALGVNAQILLNDSIVMSLQDTIDYLTPLTKWDKIDYSYISGKDDTSDITALELEKLTDGSDITLHTHDNRYYTEIELQTPGAAIIDYANIVNSPSGSNRIENGDLYFQDTTRGNKWLSVAEEQYMWTEKNIDGKYMSIGDVSSSPTGYLLPQDMTITKLSVMSTGEASKQLQIRTDGSSVFTFNLSGGKYTSITLDVDLNGGDLLQMFVSGAGNKISDVVVTLFGKWRIV